MEHTKIDGFCWRFCQRRIVLPIGFIGSVRILVAAGYSALFGLLLFSLQALGQQEAEDMPAADPSSSKASLEREDLATTTEGVYISALTLGSLRRGWGSGVALGLVADERWDVEGYRVETGYQRSKVDYEALEYGVDGKFYLFPHWAAVLGLSWHHYSEEQDENTAKEDDKKPEDQDKQLDDHEVDQGLWGKIGLGVRFDYAFPYFTSKAFSVGASVDMQLLLYQHHEVSEGFHPMEGDLFGMQDAFLSGRVFVALVL